MPKVPYAIMVSTAVATEADEAGDLAGLDRSPAPRLGPTVRSSTIVSFAGSAPDRSWMASVFALSAVKLPEICPAPPRMGSLITGADSTLLSSTIANGLLTFSVVKLAEFYRAASD